MKSDENGLEELWIGVGDVRVWIMWAFGWAFGNWCGSLCRVSIEDVSMQILFCIVRLESFLILCILYVAAIKVIR